MRFALSVAATALIALAIAIGSALYVVSQELYVSRIGSGPWTAVLYLAAADANPYAIAIRSRRNTIPTPVGEAVEFFARTDSAGDPLIGTCDYVISGTMPTSRLWTIAIDIPAGKQPPVPAARPPGYPDHAVATHGDNVLRRSDNSIRIAVAPTVRPGNWLQLTTSGPFMLVARLYDTPIGEDLQRNPLQLPAIDKVRCR